MKKKDIRHYYKDKRCQLTSSQRLKMDDLMLIQFQKMSVDIPTMIMTYSPIHKLNEFDPQTIKDYCFFRNPQHRLLYPQMVEVDGRNEMFSMLVDDETEFHRNQFGIDEPVNGIDVSPWDLDMVIVPLLGFDKKGNRVGYGQGYYDRFLGQCRKDCVKVGFSYFEPVEYIEDVNQFDIRLNYCITHEKFYTF